MPKIQFLEASTAGHPFKKGHLYRSEKNIYLFKRRGAGNGGHKQLVFEKVVGNYSSSYATYAFVKFGNQVTQTYHGPFFAHIPELEEISVEDLALYVDWGKKYPAFHRLMKEKA